MLIKLVDGTPEGYPVLQSNFLQLFPSTSFALPLTPDDVEPFGYGLYEFSSVPEASRYTKFVEVSPVKDGQGVWRQTWEETDMSDEEKTVVDLDQEKFIRSERNRLLTTCDWTQFNDSPLPDAEKSVWAAYRQTLRDVPQQVGFPWDINWPEEPV